MAFVPLKKVITEKDTSLHLTMDIISIRNRITNRMSAMHIGDNQFHHAQWQCG